jgi:diamine N-acetyltransferase
MSKLSDKKDIKIEYLEKSPSDLEIIRSLWIKLKEHHKSFSHYFKDHYAGFTFEQRKQGLVDKSRGGDLRLDLARDQKTGEYIGYCVSTLTGEKLGEIESIYIEPPYRRSGVGDGLMQRALQWMDNNQAKKKILGVAEGNENVFAFYRRYGFYPRITVLEQKEQC